MEDNLSYSETLFAEAISAARDTAATWPLWQLALLILGLLVALVLGILGLIFILKLTVRHLRQLPPKRRRIIWGAIGFFLIYVGLYLGTTTVRLGGHGG